MCVCVHKTLDSSIYFNKVFHNNVTRKIKITLELHFLLWKHNQRWQFKNCDISSQIEERDLKIPGTCVREHGTQEDI